jgi:hypothetical protein
MRTCLGCGERAAQPTLLRLAIGADGHLIVDRIRRAPGRGGYLHRRAQCWERFAARKGMVRSLRRAVDRAERQAMIARLHADSEL